jgi:hypothetical protein
MFVDWIDTPVSSAFSLKDILIFDRLMCASVVSSEFDFGLGVQLSKNLPN